MPDKNEDKKSTTDLVTSSNLVAEETIIVGNIKTQGNIRIEGKVDGALSSRNKIVVGDSAHITGDIDASEAEISGHVDGAIHCKGTLYLKKTAYINGDITATKLIIENGAVFNGKCSMTGQAEPADLFINDNGEPQKRAASR
ncbi:MAG TPA: polymer-forming cytoskeletal protein [Cyclobacteriaceae bacterium]|nr:polymer-forming cytoskeletal protein [Cyclobacteriaceae bacterium]